MLNKSRAIDRLLRENPLLGERRFGLPDIGKRCDGDNFKTLMMTSLWRCCLFVYAGGFYV